MLSEKNLKIVFPAMAKLLKRKVFFQSLQTTHSSFKYRDYTELEKIAGLYWGEMERVPHFSGGQQCCLPAPGAPSLPYCAGHVQTEHCLQPPEPVQNVKGLACSIHPASRLHP